MDFGSVNREKTDGLSLFVGPTKYLSLTKGPVCLKMSMFDNLSPKNNVAVKLDFFSIACLVARKWAEVRKWGSIIAHFPIYPKTRKGNKKTPFPFLFSLLHNHFLTSRVYS